MEHVHDHIDAGIVELPRQISRHVDLDGVVSPLAQGTRHSSATLERDLAFCAQSTHENRDPGLGLIARHPPALESLDCHSIMVKIVNIVNGTRA